MYKERQLTYLQKVWIHNSFDEIMEYTIVCEDQMEPKEIVAEIKEDVDKTFNICVPTHLIYQEINNYLSQH
jgi:hypothetical protein